jgi:hypothetical protein
MMSKLVFLSFLLTAFSVFAAAQTTAFTYQGKLSDNMATANGTYQMQFSLWDAATNGTQVGPTLTFDGTGGNTPAVQVTNGIFTVTLNFESAGPCAACFDGNPRWLQVAVKKPADATYTTLERQPLTSTPYAIKSLKADTANNSLQLGGMSAAGFIRNSTSAQPSSDFNISGSGTAGGSLSASVVNATIQFNIGGNRVLSSAGDGNLFAGVNAGPANTGTHNAFFGRNAGQNNSLGSVNTFIGSFAGASNAEGGNNVFIGNSAGYFSQTGNNNTFVGGSTGFQNFSGSGNTLIGYNANLGAPNLTNATAVGSGAQATASNTVVLGRDVDTAQVPGSLNVSGTISGNGSGLTNLNASVSTTVITLTFSVPGGGFASGIATCPGSRPNVTGGGFELPDSVGNLANIMQSRPLGGEDGWLVRVRSGAENPFNVTVWAVCAK